MSVIKTDLLQNRLGTSHPAVTKADFVKVYANIAGTNTPAILRSGFNTSSLVDNGAGAYTCIYAAPFANANYSATTGVNDISWGAAVRIHNIGSPGTPGVGAIGISCNCISPAPTALLDASIVCIAVHGDLA